MASPSQAPAWDGMGIEAGPTKLCYLGVVGLCFK
jgi:hypothetical protein